MIKLRHRTLCFLIMTLFLTACAESQFLMHTAKRVGGDEEDKGTYKIGNPYQIEGIWYYPAVDYDYDETGIASWYGPNFHGKLTANGAIYDQYAITAAHRTLPMPSVVQVTNLENGRSLVVTINDRGPFAKGRIIDLSKRSAELLGFKNQGTAKVRVEILAQESIEAAATAQPGRQALASNEAPIKVDAPAKQSVSAEALTPPNGATASGSTQVASTDSPDQSSATTAGPPPPVTSRAEPKVTQTIVEPTNIFVQAGAYGVFDNANRVRARLSQFGNVEISPVLVNGRDLYRVRLGPIDTVMTADQLLAQVMDAGFPAARVIVD